MSGWTKIPNEIEDAELDVYQFRVWVRIRRVGLWWGGDRALAQACQISLGKASQTRRWLTENGYLALASANGHTGLTAVTPPHLQCSPDEQKCSPDEQIQQESVHHMNSIVAGVHHMNGSVHVVNKSVHHMNESILINHTNYSEGEEPLCSPHEQVQQLTAEEVKLVEMVNALVDVTFMDGHLNWSALSEFAGELLDAYTPQQIVMHYGEGQSPNGHWNWYIHDWRGAKNEAPNIQAIRSTIKSAVSGKLPKTKSKSPAAQAPALEGATEYGW